ncbi:ATP-binding protein [Halorussus halophilus]|uniref:ATP-binding protein n=1 Tax=Halorussus halophilus TaxID=2650975 RepID=UPI001CE48E22|nr:hypothetical protein [Halorussus halophilus]
MDAIPSQIQRLHSLAEPFDDRSWRKRRSGDPLTPRTIEWVLVASSDGIEYYVGLHDEDLEGDPDLTSLETLLRGLFPDRYEFEQCTFDPASVLDIPDSLLHTDAEGSDDERHLAGVEFVGRGKRRADWQTRLTPFDEFHTEQSSARPPLASVAETLATTDTPVVFQVLLQPKPDWMTEAGVRQRRLKKNEESFIGKLITKLFAPKESYSTESASEQPVAPENQRRLDALEDRDTHHGFSVNVRAATTAQSAGKAKRTVDSLSTAFTPVSGRDYRIGANTHYEALCASEPPRKSQALDLLDAITGREFQQMTTGLSSKLPGRGRVSPEIVAAHDEVPSFCLLGGSTLSTNAERALGLTPGEQTVIPRPPQERLARYRQQGLTLGVPLTQDGRPESSPVSLPPSLQPLHVAWFGKTGSGKSTGVTTGMLENHAATRGPSILIDPKGDGMPVEYLRAHYAKYGTLDNVYYFECSEVLPALSFFDIRPQLAAGVDRETAVQDVVDHYIEILVGIMGRENFESAVRSPDIIRYLVKALFDPVHGSDAFSHRELQEATTRMKETRDAPSVSDEDLAVLLGGVVTNSKRSFTEVMQGVQNRIEKIPLDYRLARLFNHVPNLEDGSDDPYFDFFEVLDEDAVVVVDTSQLRSKSRNGFTLALLSNLWTALRRRYGLYMKNGGSPTTTQDDLPLVNLYLEEAADVAASGLMTDLLSQSRGFGLSVTLAMQFPAQVREADSEAYAEILNNVSTIVTGNVAVDPDLEKKLATEEMPPREVGNRLRALRRGQWFVRLPAAFGEPEPRPFLLESAPLPSGHPESDDPLSEMARVAFNALFDVVRDRSRLDHGLDLVTDDQSETTTTATESTETTAESETTEDLSSARVDSALPYTKRLPKCITYDGDLHAIVCGECENRYTASLSGILRGIECCSSLARVDRDKIPISDVGLMLSESERRESEYSDRQLCFLQAVYSAHQFEYDPEYEYDPRWDTMLRLQEYVGIESEDLQELLDDELLRIDCDHPHRLYTVTAKGRSEIQVAHREGVSYGHGVGDLGESTLHRVMVAFGRQYVETAYETNAESSVVDVVPYYELDDGHRLDVAGLDSEGEVRVVVEAERSNNDTLRAVPEDYDKMAELDPEDAIWIVENREGAHKVLSALNDPPTGKVRVAKSYSESSAPQIFTLDAPGCTEIHTLRYLRDSLLEVEPPEIG